MSGSCSFLAGRGRRFEGEEEKVGEGHEIGLDVV